MCECCLCRHTHVHSHVVIHIQKAGGVYISIDMSLIKFCIVVEREEPKVMLSNCLLSQLLLESETEGLRVQGQPELQSKTKL